MSASDTPHDANRRLKHSGTELPEARDHAQTVAEFRRRLNNPDTGPVELMTLVQTALLILDWIKVLRYWPPQSVAAVTSSGSGFDYGELAPVDAAFMKHGAVEVRERIAAMSKIDPEAVHNEAMDYVADFCGRVECCLFFGQRSGWRIVASRNLQPFVFRGEKHDSAFDAAIAYLRTARDRIAETCLSCGYDPRSEAEAPSTVREAAWAALCLLFDHDDAAVRAGRREDDIALADGLYQALRQEEAAVRTACERQHRERVALQQFAELSIVPAARAPEAANQTPKGRPGRRGYSIQVLKYAQKLRLDHPEMKLRTIRQKCVEKFGKDFVPINVTAFRAFMKRGRNRTN